MDITWGEAQELVQDLAKWIREKNLLAITRGGLVPAAMLSHVNDFDIIDTVCITSYVDRQQGQLRVSKCPDIGTGLGWFILDDIVDSGETIKTLRRLFPDAQYGALIAKPDGVDQINSYSLLVPQDTWVIFPWEKD